MTEPGLILYLNGSSSAGKGMLSRAIQRRFAEPFLHIGADTMFEAVEGTGWNQYGRPEDIDAARGDGIRWLLGSDGHITAMEFGEAGRRLIYGLHAMTAALAYEGNNVVVDDVIFEPDMAAHLGRTLAELPAYLIGVRCGLEELERRETERGNRLLGLARLLHERPHEHIPAYDLEVDTARMSAEEAADAVHRFMDRPPKPHAMRALAQLAGGRS
ncbi:MAG TPA: hypothetical protein VHK28_02150 [Candidatus Limnocylindria bacterium]|nr:hypothetical protein [Candidatus Limnocylindria bacterium]